MFIRYFATNRDRDKLGRNLERDKRIQLQKGGYHWLNMDEYMSHYLGTTDSSSFPEEVYILDSDQCVFADFLSRKSVKRIVICVHGFNVELHEAHTWYTIFATTLGCTSAGGGHLKKTIITDPLDPSQKFLLANDNNDLTAVVGFSWPSNGNAVSYEADRTEALSSRTALANLIGRVKARCPQASVVLIAHSMGNLLSCQMLAAIVDEEFQLPDFKLPDYRAMWQSKKPQRFIDKYIMIAPDIERRQVTQCDLKVTRDNKEELRSVYLGPYYAGLKYAVGEVHNFYSRFDKALLISNTEKSVREKIENVKEFFTGQDNPETRYEQRLGLTAHPAAIAPGNMTSHNAVVLSNREIDHSDYQDCLPVIELVASIILK